MWVKQTIGIIAMDVCQTQEIKDKRSREKIYKNLMT